MAAVLKHWREASTLILVTARQRGSNVIPKFISATGGTSPDIVGGTNKELLLLKRSSKSKFMPNLYVFPGGMASDADFSSDWILVFDLLGNDHRENLFDFVQRGGQGAPMFSRLRDRSFSHIPSEIAFRICAIRETFEESGVLIARKVCKGDEFQPSLWNGPSWASYCQDESVINEWRHRVDKDPEEFLRMCQELQIVPDVWSLYEWSNWLTPLNSSHRYDTAFYLCCVDGKPAVAEDEGETVHSQWGTPFDIIKQYYEARVSVAPPQLYEIQRLKQFMSVEELLQFAWHRAEHRVERWLPVRVNAADSVLSVLPGDSLYPEDLNPEGPAVDYTYDKTAAELAASHPHMHRTQHILDNKRGVAFGLVVCNVTLPGNQISPPSTEVNKTDDSVTFTPKL